MKSLREVRAERLLSIRDLAEQAGVAPSTVYLFEAGGSVPRPRVVRRLAQVLQVEPRQVEEFQRAIEAARAPVRQGRQPHAPHHPTPSDSRGN
jgi:transcriptional regulator with XRE-family HTH domain